MQEWQSEQTSFGKGGVSVRAEPLWVSESGTASLVATFLSLISSGFKAKAHLIKGVDHEKVGYSLFWTFF